MRYLTGTPLRYLSTLNGSTHDVIHCVLVEGPNTKHMHVVSIEWVFSSKNVAIMAMFKNMRLKISVISWDFS